MLCYFTRDALTMEPQSTIRLYRMVMADHMCPSGLKTKAFLEREKISFEDHHLTSRAEVDALKEKHGVKTTPLLMIDDEVIGGYEATLAHYGKNPTKSETSYLPVIMLFAVAALMAVATTWLAQGAVISWQTIPWFISIAMVLLGLQKLKDIDSFATMFLTYDLLAQRWVRYGYIYPFLETGAGLLMFAGVLTWLSAPTALIFGGIGAISVFKAVYIDKRELKCACVGGNTNVPLGFVSLLENIMMVGMALWMLAGLMFGA